MPFPSEETLEAEQDYDYNQDLTYSFGTSTDDTTEFSGTLAIIGDMATAALTEGTTQVNVSQAQMLGLVGHSAGTIESESGVSASRAQMYDQIGG